MSFQTIQQAKNAQQTITTSNIPLDAIRAEEAGILPPIKGQEGVMKLRWQANEFLSQLWRNLAGRTYKEFNGEAYLIKAKGTNPPLSDEGAMDVINLITSVVNPVVSLSNLDDEEIRNIYSETRRACRRMLVLKEEEYGATSRADKEKVMAILSAIVWSQLTRGLYGHESDKSITNIQEARTSEELKQSISAGKGFMMGGNKT